MVNIDFALVKAELIKQCLSFTTFKKKANISEGAIRSLRHGKAVRISSAGKIALALGIPVEQLIKQ